MTPRFEVRYRPTGESYLVGIGMCPFYLLSKEAKLEILKHLTNGVNSEFEQLAGIHCLETMEVPLMVKVDQSGAFPYKIDSMYKKAVLNRLRGLNVRPEDCYSPVWHNFFEYGDIPTFDAYKREYSILFQK